SHVAAALDDLLGRPTGAIVQPMGVHLALFADETGPPPPHPFPEGYAIFVGRFVEKKGLRYLLDAMPSIRARHPGLGLVLVGYGELETEVRAQIASLGLEDAVHLTGKIPHRELIPWLRHARLAVVPSIVDRNGETDGMPTVVSEAMAAGLPVVGCAVDGIPDVI